MQLIQKIILITISVLQGYIVNVYADYVAVGDDRLDWMNQNIISYD